MRAKNLALVLIPVFSLLLWPLAATAGGPRTPEEAWRMGQGLGMGRKKPVLVRTSTTSRLLPRQVTLSGTQTRTVVRPIPRVQQGTCCAPGNKSCVTGTRTSSKGPRTTASADPQPAAVAKPPARAPGLLARLLGRIRRALDRQEATRPRTTTLLADRFGAGSGSSLLLPDAIRVRQLQRLSPSTLLMLRRSRLVSEAELRSLLGLGASLTQAR